MVYLFLRDSNSESSYGLIQYIFKGEGFYENIRS